MRVEVVGLRFFRSFFLRSFLSYDFLFRGIFFISYFIFICVRLFFFSLDGYIWRGDGVDGRVVEGVEEVVGGIFYLFSY